MQTPPLTPVVRNLLIINVGIFLIDYLLQAYHGMVLSQVFGLSHVSSDRFYPFQFFTYMFLHADFSHLLMNMLGLFMMGAVLELVWKSKRFLIFYLITGIGAGLIYSLVRYIEWYPVITAYESFVANPSFEALISFDSAYPGGLPFDLDPYEGKAPAFYKAMAEELYPYTISRYLNVPCVGASGAIFGIIAALALVMPNMEMLVFPLPFPIKLKYLAIVYLAVELFMGVRKVEGDHVAHFAHLGGAVIAFLYVRYWEKIGKMFS